MHPVDELDPVIADLAADRLLHRVHDKLKHRSGPPTMGLLSASGVRNPPTSRFGMPRTAGAGAISCADLAPEQAADAGCFREKRATFLSRRQNANLRGVESIIHWEDFIMPAKKLKTFLDDHEVKYLSIQHSPAYTAPEIAAAADVSGNNFAKTVIVKQDGDLAMVVLPANRKIVLSELREMMLSDRVELATEHEFQARFPDCELGAMPPFGNLYGLPVYLSKSLADAEEIAFNAGTHREVIKMPFEQYANLVSPTVVDLATV